MAAKSNSLHFQELDLTWKKALACLQGNLPQMPEIKWRFEIVKNYFKTSLNEIKRQSYTFRNMVAKLTESKAREKRVP